MNEGQIEEFIEKEKTAIVSEVKQGEKKILEFAKYENRLLGKFFHKVVSRVLGKIIRAVWVGEITGIRNIPKEGSAIIAFNHSSYFDFLCFSAIAPRKIHYIAAEKFFSSKIWKPLMLLSGQIRVDRTHHDKSKVFEQVFSALEDGRIIGIFPEGTRSDTGKLQKAYVGVAKIALRTKTPVIPVGIIGTHEILAKHHKFPRLKKAKIHIGDPISLKELHGLQHEDRHFRMATDVIMHRIAELSRQKYPHAEYQEIQI